MRKSGEFKQERKKDLVYSLGTDYRSIHQQ